MRVNIEKIPRNYVDFVNHTKQGICDISIRV